MRSTRFRKRVLEVRIVLFTGHEPGFNFFAVWENELPSENINANVDAMVI